MTPGPAAALSGAAVPDLAVCLESDQDPACFSATRVNARTSAGISAPTAPTNLVAAVSGGTVTLTWIAPTSGDPVATYVLDAGSSAGTTPLCQFPDGNYFDVLCRSRCGSGNLLRACPGAECGRHERCL